MIEKVEGIILDVRRYSDTHDIVTIYTQSRGRMACISAAGTSKSGRLRRARLQPLSVIGASVRFNASRELQTLGAFDMLGVTPDIYYNPVKRSMAFFLAEFLNNLLRASAPDASVYQNIINVIDFLESTQKNIANLHIAFLGGLLQDVGIYPDFSGYSADSFFDMTKGEFVLFRPRHKEWLQGRDAEVFTYISQITLENSSSLVIDAESRSRLLSNLLQYYNVHFPGVSNLNSLAVLSEIFR